METKLYLKPWIGKNYEVSSNKILLLGESHYDTYGNANKNFTNEIISEVLGGAKYKYFVNTGRLFNKDHKKIWDSIAFSNVIQTIYKNGKSQPTLDDRAIIPENFEILINTLKPDKVIVLSKRLWDWISENNAEQQESIKMGPRHSTVWQYQYTGGNCKAIGICHPSWMFGKNGTLDEWSVIVDEFIKR